MSWVINWPSLTHQHSAMVAKTLDDADFTEFDEGANSSVCEDWVRRCSQEGNKIKQVRKVAGITLRSILDLEGVPNSVDLLSIDAEGADEDALTSINFESLPIDRFPKWLLLETTPPVDNSLSFGSVVHALKFGYVPWLVLPMTTLLRRPESLSLI
jgi:hypothetical protein